MSEHDQPDIQSGLFSELWKNSPDNMFLLRVADDDYYIVSTNHAQQQTVDLSHVDMHGRALKEALPPALYELVVPNYDRCVASGEPQQYEETEQLTSADGSQCYWSTMLSPVFDEQQRVAFIFGISRNITPLKQAQARAEKAAREAEKADQVKTTFLANMSHEMRTPLNGIQSAAELLAEISAQPEQHELCQLIRRSAEALTRLTSDILEYAKMDAGALRLENKDFSLQEVCRDVSMLLRPAAVKKQLDFRITQEDGLPARLHGDAGRLKQVLLNLTANAIKFTTHGAVHIHIEKAAANNGVTVLNFSVTDTGIGIREDDLERLFLPFSQIDDSTTRHYEGTGLGLAISKYLTEKMGGRISVRSVAGEGSVFAFSLPFTAATGSAVPATAVPVTQGLAGLKVLLVEDNTTNQIVMEQMLGNAGLAVDVAANGRQALKLCTQQTFDLVLMDWHMPVMDGLECTRALRRLSPAWEKIPVIGLTADVMSQDMAEFTRAGMNDVITKPVRRRELLDKMAAVLAAETA
ncbi:MAG: response regulator [Pseudomonadota bacterium]|nr:response regulator [Pseudomonadota bacterium]